jgi:hypothetical protein
VGVGGEGPFSLREVEPHQDIDGHGERAVHEAGFNTKCKKHKRSSITTK